MLACADIEEGVVLRQAGVRAPILVFGALSVSDLDGVFEHDLTPTVSTPGAARALQARGREPRRRAPVSSQDRHRHEPARLPARQPRRTLPERAASRHLSIDAVYTHFATADDPDHPAFDEQQRPLRARARAAAGAGPREPTVRHAANSAALLRDERTWYDCVRPGLLLYGIVPPPLAATLELRPALSLHSRIVAVKGMRAGRRHGLRTALARRRAATIAIVPAGYADGLDTRLAGRGFVLVRGRRVPIVGSVCMDMIDDRRHRPRRFARRRGRHHRPQGRGIDWRPRDGRRHRHDSLGVAVPVGSEDRAGVFVRTGVASGFSREPLLRLQPDPYSIFQFPPASSRAANCQMTTRLPASRSGPASRSISRVANAPSSFWTIRSTGASSA